MGTLRDLGAHLRILVIVDACYAAQIAFVQSDNNEMVGHHLRQVVSRGIAVFCSSSKDTYSEFLPDESNTRFTSALVDALYDGDASLESRLSLAELEHLVVHRLGAEGPKPEVHAPYQPKGNPAHVKIFPNGPRRKAHEAAARDHARTVAVVNEYIEKQQREQVEANEKAKVASRQAKEAAARQLLDAAQRARFRQEQAVKVYSSEEERTFRKEAEDVRQGARDLKLLAAWIHWRTDFLRLQVQAERAKAAEHSRDAAEHRRLIRMTNKIIRRSGFIGDHKRTTSTASRHRWSP